MSEGTHRRLAAILAADVAGYSRMMGEDESGTLADLRLLRGELFEPVVASHRGNVVKRMGDGWLVEFNSAVDAVNCAIAIQNGLVGHDRISVRIGIHVGDIVHEDEDVYGDGVNIAARLQEIVEPGGLAISAFTYESVKGAITETFRDAGERELKNIASDFPTPAMIKTTSGLRTA
jgi:adenylate cyclase